MGKGKQQSNGEWISKLQVAAGDGKNGCGYFEAPISVVGHGFVAREEPPGTIAARDLSAAGSCVNQYIVPTWTPVDPKDQPDGSGELSYQIYLPILKR
ncbi:MAG: hypothetical protein R2867_08960 [Caldilineaceae bacterium]